MNKKSLRGESMLFISAFIWGIAFIAQRVGGDIIGSFTFNAIRMLIGGFTLIPCIYLMRNKTNIRNEKALMKKQWFNKNKKLFTGGLICGIIVFVASNLQQIGLSYTTASKAGFITALYIIIVPIIGIFFKKYPSINLWISIFLALCGMYLLCITDGFNISTGDILMILSALAFSFHILAIDYFSSYVDGVKMSCIQFFVCGFFSLIAMFLFETPVLSSILQAWLPLLYTGVLSCGVAYTFQILGQKNVNSSVASLIMSLEGVFCALGGWILLGESMSIKEMIGCILVFGAILLAQIPSTRIKTDTIV